MLGLEPRKVTHEQTYGAGPSDPPRKLATTVGR
jgi:hypothetical protein